MAKKVKFNIHDVYYAPVTTSGFGTPVALPGAVSISLEPQDGDNEIFYADGVEYYVQASATGYEGDLEMALIDDAFRKAIYGETEDTSHNLWESIDDTPNKFALGFVIDGATDGASESTYFWYQNCSATKPSVESSTNEEAKTVGTDTITIKCSPNADGYVRVKSTSLSTTSSWFDSVISTPSGGGE